MENTQTNGQTLQQVYSRLQSVWPFYESGGLLLHT